MSKELSSSFLQRSFVRKFRAGNNVRSDDADIIVSHQSEIFQHLFEVFFVAGNYPWDDKIVPEISFKFPDKDCVAKSLLPFIFPIQPIKKTHLEITNPSIGINHLFYSEVNSEYSFENLYFPQDTEAPYLFIMRYNVTPLTMPTFSHDLDFKDLLLQCNPENFPRSQIVIAVKTKFPYYTLFKSFFLWIIQAENVGRFEILPKLDGYLHTKSYDFSQDMNIAENGGSLLVGNRVWPDNQRQIMNESLFFFLISTPPERNNKLEYDAPPLPIFSWTRPDVQHSYLTLAVHCWQDIAKSVTPDIFIMAYSAAFLEHSLIVYHPTISVITNFVLGLHFALRPFRWVGGSIAPLPMDLLDFLNSPTPMICGLIKPLEEMEHNHVYINLVNKKLKVLQKMPLIAGHDDLKKKLSDSWSAAAEGKEEAALVIINTLYQNMSIIYNYLKASIISCLSEKEKTKSTFVEELFLERFQPKDRPYMKQMIETQMFRIAAEQEAKLKSDTHLL